GPGLQQQHPAIRVFRETRSHHPAAGPAADDDYVVPFHLYPPCAARVRPLDPGRPRVVPTPCAAVVRPLASFQTYRGTAETQEHRLAGGGRRLGPPTAFVLGG